MKSILRQLITYLRYIWEDKQHKPSIKRILAIYFAWITGSNTSYAIRKWSEGRSMNDLYLVLGISAALVASLLGLTAYFNYIERKLDQNNSSTTQPLPPGE